MAQAQVAQPDQASSVEVYGGSSFSESEQQGVMPNGMMWNRPLKAGELVLPRVTKETPKAVTKAAPPRMPVGQVKPPQLSTKSKTTPPQIASDRNSTTSVMMLQGMKSALQQSGQNADIPKSTLPDDKVPAAMGDEPVMVDMLAAEKPDSIQNMPAPKIMSAPKDDYKYEAGEGPKTFVLQPEAPAALPKQDTQGTTTSDETYADTLNEASDLAGTSPKDKIIYPAEMATGAKPTSIFGEPVEEPAPNQEPEATTQTAPAKSEPSFWSRLFGSDDAKEPAVAAPSQDNAQDMVPVPESTQYAPAALPDTNAQAAVEQPETTAHMADGSCGTANGLATAQKPAFGSLCQAGTPTAISGNGPWRWSCKGSTGGMTVSCAAPLDSSAAPKPAQATKAEASTASTVEDGLCGSAHNQGAVSPPIKGLCTKGTPSRVNGDGPWTWACSGSNGGQAAACAAHLKADGVCGSAISAGAETMPVQDLCSAGLASAVTGNGPWNWTCSGLYGGEAVTCSAQPKENAICGAAAQSGHESAPSKALCNAGTASSVSGDGPWSWQCAGSHGGATVSCSAPKLADGICGAAHGSTYESTPNEGLCASGRASRVTGLGPWNWSCIGVDGGQTVSCAASLGTKEAVESVVRCGEASETLSFAKPQDRLCAAGTATAVTGEGPWSWACMDDAGHQTNCSTLSASDGACGAAANKASAQEPRTGLCKSGTPSSVKTDRSNGVWEWNCSGALGGSAKACSAPMGKSALEAPAPKTEISSKSEPLAQCGASAGRSFGSLPEDDLCLAGKATAVRGTGPWKWTCEAKGKSKAKVMCEADKLSDGICGPVNGSIQRSAPRSDLCTSGTSTEVTGSGPWMWSCVGSGGGVSVSCSAASQTQTKVDGTCGAAANAVMPAAPTVNLCDSGVASAVNGDGPWTWTCSGMNGGIASTCTTSKVLPKAPPPPGPSENGLCGSSNGVAFDERPTDNLCAAGMTSDISGNGPWNWSCIGVNGGMTVSCTAPLTPPPPIVGMCGASSGVPTLTIPKGSLCSAGIASAVSGQGPWTWSCSGTNGGSAVSCVAPKAGGSALGTPSLTTPSLGGGDEAPAPKAAPLGLVTPQLSAPSLKPLKPGTVPNLTPSKSLSKTSAPDGGAVKDLATSQAPAKAAAKVVAEEAKGLNPDASTIDFMVGSDKLEKEAMENLDQVTAFMLANKNARLTMVAYSTTDGKISPRQARRISLNRALAARDYLASKGVDSSRVDVKPMGANVPSGDMDRIDIKLN